MERPPIKVGDHVVRVLRNGREVFPAMLDAIAEARRLIRVEMYWWEDDAIGRRFLDAVVGAARRGVDVRVIVDGFGSYSLAEAFWDPLRSSGGRAETFRLVPGPLTGPGLGGLLARNHRKILIADDRAFVGGLNLALPWAPVGEGGEDWRDAALEVRGVAASRHLGQLFEGSWAIVTGQARGEPPLNIAWVDERPLAIFSNTPTRRRGRRIRQAYLWALRRATRTVDITCTYFAPRPLFLRALTQAARRGVRVRLLVPLRSDVELARLASLPLLRWIARRGVDVFAYGGAILHGKTAVFDGEWCTVGSHNLDGLSWAWNLECNAVLRDTAVAAQLTSLFEEDLCLSVRWPPPGSGLLERLLPDAFRRWYASG